MLWSILFFAPMAFGATEWWSRALLQGMIFILSVMCAVRRDFSSFVGGPLYGFAVIIALGAIQLIHLRPLAEPACLLPFSGSRSQTLSALVMWAAFASLLWATSGILRWEGAFRRVALAIFAIGTFIAVVGILQRGQGNTAYFGLRPIRHGLPFGPFTNRDHAASWMVASTFVGVGLFAEGFRRLRAPLTERIPKQVLIAFALIVQLAAVSETSSRGAMNALFVAGLLTAVLLTRSLAGAMPRLLFRSGLILAGCSYVVSIYFNPNWLGYATGALDNSTAYRLSMYRSGIRMVADFPAFGIGLGGFLDAFHAYQEPLVAGLVEHIHSSWLEIAVETGLFGLVAFLSVMLKPLAVGGRLLASGSGIPRSMPAGCFAALLSVFLHGFVEFNFQIPAIAVLSVILLAMVDAPRMDIGAKFLPTN